MDVLGSANQVELNLFRTQLDERKQINALASGLRVQSASDDPSGLAIADTIQAKVLGLQQGVQNVQNAHNLLNVADAALGTVQDILSHIHSLIVEASSDLNSNTQLESIQTEINSLLQEVNKIAVDTKFNGINLLDGSRSATTFPQVSITQVNSPALPDGSIPTGSNVVNYDGLGNSGPLVLSFAGGSGPGGGGQPQPTSGGIPAFMTFAVTGYDAATSSDIITFSAYSSSPAMGVAPLWVTTQEFAVNSGQSNNIQISSPSGLPGNVLLNLSIANLTQQDVGVSESFVTNIPPSTTPIPGNPIAVNSGAGEGDEVQIALPSATASALNISEISVLAPLQENDSDQVVGTASNQYATSDAEARVQLALDAISSARAQIGAQAVALQENANDASLAIVNQTASESAIRDANVAQDATQFVADQVLTKIGTSVLAQLQASAQLVVQLVGNVTPKGAGLI